MNRMRLYKWSGLDAPARRLALLRPALTQNPDLEGQVRDIIATVRRDGDAALIRFARQLDRAELTALRVSDDEAQAAEAELPAQALAAIGTAIANVRRFHEAQGTAPIRVETAPGVVCERISKPLGAVGLYVPAGSAPLPSTVRCGSCARRRDRMGGPIRRSSSRPGPAAFGTSSRRAAHRLLPQWPMGRIPSRKS